MLVSCKCRKWLNWLNPSYQVQLSPVKILMEAKLYTVKFRLATLLKETPTQAFCCKIWEIFKNTFFEEHLRTTAFIRKSWLKIHVTYCWNTQGTELCNNNQKRKVFNYCWKVFHLGILDTVSRDHSKKVSSEESLNFYRIKYRSFYM